MEKVIRQVRIDAVPCGILDSSWQVNVTCPTVGVVYDDVGSGGNSMLQDYAIQHPRLICRCMPISSAEGGGCSFIIAVPQDAS